jgi:hypothetical protein
MANNIIAASRRSSIFDKICLKLRWPRGSIGGLRRKAKWYAAGTPAVDANSHTTYPVSIGDLAWDTTNSYAYINTVAPTANTAATFVKLHA